jgi:hypothetical protein
MIPVVLSFVLVMLMRAHDGGVGVASCCCFVSMTSLGTLWD